MDRISDSGSDGWGSNPHGGTKKKVGGANLFLIIVPYPHGYLGLS